MKRKKIIGITVLFIGIPVAVSAFIFVSRLPEKSLENLPGLSGLSGTLTSAPSIPVSAPANDPFADKLVSQLQRLYGRTIADKGVQAGLAGIRDFVAALHPQKGSGYFHSILKRAFPEYADEIMQTLDKIDAYHRWLLENRDRLKNMTASERLAALEAKQKELFGRDAAKIWSGELLAADARRARMHDALAALNEERGMSLGRKLDDYKRALRETYEGTPESFVLKQGGILSKAFFSLDSVQEALNRMSPAERQEEINRLRAGMGFTDQQVASMARRDAENAGRWEAGLKYMDERDAVVRQYEGREREERLGELRAEYFGDEAKTIALEEKENFYRFKRKHIWGRN